MLIFAPGDLAGLGADQLHIISDSRDSNRPLGQLWRAVKASSDEEASMGRGDHSVFVSQGRGASKLAEAVSADTA